MHFEKPVTQKPIPQPRRTPCAVPAAVAVVFFLSAFPACAMQHHAAPPPPAAANAPSGFGGIGHAHAGAGNVSQPSSSVQLGPVGRWWDNKSFSKAIGLKREQQQRMDAVFNANKSALFNTYRSLKAEEAKLDALKRADTPDEDKILAQIDVVSALRGQLEKQSASLALQLRKELTPEQVRQLEAAQ